MAVFEIAYKRTAINEGGYSNNVNDRGAETYKGISRRAWPNWMGWKHIDDAKSSNAFPALLESNTVLQQTIVPEFYQQNYWAKIKATEIQSQEVANELYDSAVNFGDFTAIMMLQRSLNLLNKNARLWPDLLLDGKMGVATLEATNKANSSALLKSLNGFQFMKYALICEHDPSQEVFYLGWLNRI